MEWMKASSVEELKKLGKLTEVKQDIDKDLKAITGNLKITNYLKLGSNSWKGQFKKIEELRKISNSLLCNDLEKNKLENEEIEYSSGYFKDEASEYIFYLLELEGQARMDKLKIYKTHYRDKGEAKKWRDKIAKIIYPDKVKTLEAAKAMEELNSIYKNMVSDE